MFVQIPQDFLSGIEGGNDGCQSKNCTINVKHTRETLFKTIAIREKLSLLLGQN